MKAKTNDLDDSPFGDFKKFEEELSVKLGEEGVRSTKTYDHLETIDMVDTY